MTLTEPPAALYRHGVQPEFARRPKGAPPPLILMLERLVSNRRRIVLGLSVALLGACSRAPDPETDANPLQRIILPQERLEGERSVGGAYAPRADGLLTAKVFAPAPQVWDALVNAMTARKVALTVLDRAAGRMGDTALVMRRRWNNKTVSYYLGCGSTMTGLRADEDRVRGIFIAQMSRLRADTIGIAVLLSATSTSMSGNAADVQPCTSSGRAEAELLDEVIQRVGGAGRR